MPCPTPAPPQAWQVIRKAIGQAERHWVPSLTSTGAPVHRQQRSRKTGDSTEAHRCQEPKETWGPCAGRAQTGRSGRRDIHGRLVVSGEPRANRAAAPGLLSCLVTRVPRGCGVTACGEAEMGEGCPGRLHDFFLLNDEGTLISGAVLGSDWTVLSWTMLSRFL